MQYDEKDFPVALLPDNQHGVLFCLTKAGLLFMFEIQSGKVIFGQKASANTMFASVEGEPPVAGVMAVDQTGRVSHFFVDEKNIVPYICNVSLHAAQHSCVYRALSGACANSLRACC